MNKINKTSESILWKDSRKGNTSLLLMGVQTGIEISAKFSEEAGN